MVEYIIKTIIILAVILGAYPFLKLIRPLYIKRLEDEDEEKGGAE